MKKILVLLVFYFVTGIAPGQKTLLVEKIGTSRRYFYHAGDYLKIRVFKQDTLLEGKLWSVGDSMITIAVLRPTDIRLDEINAVYKKFAFPKKLGKYMFIGSAVMFGIIGFNHLINNEQVFTQDMFIISGAMLGAGLASLSLSEKRCRTGKRWKLKVLDIELR